MNRETRSRKSNNQGFTIVELLCTLAIFSCIVAIVGGVLVVTARTFRSGTTETSLQEEAQVTINVIENLIVDATEAVNYFYKDASGAWQEATSEVGTTPGTDRKLQISNGPTETYEVIFERAAKSLRYQKVGEAAYDVATNVTDFGVDISHFSDTHSVILALGLEQEGRTYYATYNVTSRNQNVAANTYVSTEWASIVMPTGSLYIEPGQEVSIDLTVNGHVDGGAIVIESYLVNAHSNTAITQSGYNVTVKAAKEETGAGLRNEFSLVVKTQKTGINGQPLAKVEIPVVVRRVNSMSVSGAKTVGSLDKDAKNQVYVVNANLAGSNLPKKIGHMYDDPTAYAGIDAAWVEAYDYKNPHVVEWSFEVFNASGVAVNTDDYLEMIDLTTYEALDTDLGTDSARKFKLKEDLPNGYKVKATCTALHPAGTVAGTKYNKSGDFYGTVSQYFEFTSDGVPVDWATINAPDDIVIEPGQTLVLDIDVDGEYVSGEVSWACDVVGATDTSVSVNETDKKLTVTAGTQESKNAGEVGEYQLFVYTDTRYKPDGSGEYLASDTINVKVRRVKSMILDAEYDTANSLDAHEAGQTYTLSAELGGIHLSKYASYDTDKDDYVDPYSVAWAFVATDASGNALNPDDYIEVTDKDDNTAGNKAECKFTLKQNMPDGMKLTAVCASLHTMGTDGTNFYNKSHAAYSPIVQESFTIESDGVPVEEPIVPTYTLDGSKFKRGNDYWFQGDEVLSVACDYTYANAAGASTIQRYFWRYREINADGTRGAWAPYRRIMDNSGSAYKVCGDETRALRPDKPYELEFIVAVVDATNKVLYYPFSDSLLEADGFTTFTKGWSGAVSTEADVYAKRYLVGATQLKFQVGTDASWNPIYQYGLGTAANPIHVYTGTELNFPMTADFMYYGDTQADYGLIVEELDGSGNWVTSSKTPGYFTIQIASQEFKFQQNAPSCEEERLSGQRSRSAPYKERGCYHPPCRP